MQLVLFKLFVAWRRKDKQHAQYRQKNFSDTGIGKSLTTNMKKCRYE